MKTRFRNVVVLTAIVFSGWTAATAQTIPKLAWDESSSSPVNGYSVTVDGVRVDYQLTPVNTNGTCGCSMTLPFSGGRHTIVVGAYNVSGEALSSPLVVGPSANAAGPYSGQAGSALTVSGSGSSDPTGTITAYDWNWGDGTSAHGSSSQASHSYLSAGTFTITLTITDNAGATASATTTATISSATPTQPPAAPSNPTPPSGSTGVSTFPILPTLGWSSAGATSYAVNFGPSNPPPQVATGLTSASYAPTSLLAGTTYFWRIVATNAAGATTGPVWSFATTTSDTTPPAVTGRTPASGATNVATTTAVTATFSEAMTAATLSATTVRLSGPGNVQVPSTVTYNVSTRTVTLTPAAALTNANVYTATVKAGVTDLAGNAMTGDAIWSFTTASAGTGTGLNGQYYNDPSTGTPFTTLALTRTDATVNFDWGTGSPAPTVQSDNFSVRWTGQVAAPVAGTYTFSTTSDDGVRLWVNGQLLINNWTVHAPTNNSASIALASGVRYDLKLEYYEKGGGAVARLLWAYPGQAQQVVPQARLYPPSGLPNQGPTVNAGADQIITLPNTATLVGIAADDGQPSPPGTLGASWSRVSGPGTVTFSAPAALSTAASFSTSGVYTLRLTVTDGAIPASDDVVITVNPMPASGTTGTGLTGQYFNDPGTGTHFATLALTRTDATVNFDWVNGSPAAGVSIDNFSVRWTGQVAAPVTGTYTFRTTSDDGVRLWVNGQLLIDNWTDHAATDNTASIALAGGVRYDLRLEFYERGGQATARLLWAYPGQAQQVVPQAKLYP